MLDEKDIPEYNRIDYENDDLLVQEAKREAIRRQEEAEQYKVHNNFHNNSQDKD